jgi:hypothetical protein
MPLYPGDNACALADEIFRSRPGRFASSSVSVGIAATLQ